MLVNGKALSSVMPVTPFSSEKIREHGVSYGLGEAGYDIRIKQDITFKTGPRGGRTVWVDGSWEWGHFTLASSIEHFNMPDHLVGVVHDKSTWARQGLSVFNTVIEPGWNGFLTLELVYHGQGELHIPAGAGIAQVLFHQVKEPVSYSGKYQGQGNEPIPAIWEN